MVATLRSSLVLLMVLQVVSILPCLITARSNSLHSSVRRDTVQHSHTKVKKEWELPYTSDVQDEPILSGSEEPIAEKAEVGGEQSANTIWLEISKDFREKVQLNKNSDGALECDAVGSPPPDVYWYKNGLPVESMTVLTNDENAKNRIELGNVPIFDKFGHSGMANVKAKLPLRCVQPEDEGEYTCVATTKAGKRITATTYVSVIGEDSSIPRKSCEYRLSPLSYKKIKKGLSPLIFNTQTFHMDTMGKHISLPCKSAGKPRPHITWSDQDGNRISSGKKFQVSSSGSLVIRSLLWADMGVYTCTAENAFGKDSTTTFVYPFAEES